MWESKAPKQPQLTPIHARYECRIGSFLGKPQYPFLQISLGMVVGTYLKKKYCGIDD
jgi:hypothetical protein